jgi:hypothetical protein
MSRSAQVVLYTAALTLGLVALSVVSKGQEVSTDSQGRGVVTAPPISASPSVNSGNSGPTIPEGTVTMYSNFGSGNSYDCCDGWLVSGSASGVLPYVYLEAMAFTPTKDTYRLTQLDVAIGWGGGSNGYKLELRRDGDGQPGGRIAEWEVLGLPTFAATSSAVQTIKVRGLIILEKGRQYWLVPVPHSDEWVSWNWNSVGVTGNGAYSIDGGAIWQSLEYSPNGAFDVLGQKLF